MSEILSYRRIRQSALCSPSRVETDSLILSANSLRGSSRSTCLISTRQRKALDVDYTAGEADQDGCEGRAPRAVRDIPDSRGGAEGVRGDPGSDTTNRSDLTEDSTDMTVSQPFVSPTNSWEPAMSLCLNDRRNRIHLPSNLDLSSEIVPERPSTKLKGRDLVLNSAMGALC